MFRKILCLIISWILLFCMLPISSAEPQEPFDVDDLSEDYIIVVNANNPTESVCGLEKNADKKCYPASTTKILTCLIALEEGDLDEKIKIPASADSDRVAGTTMGIQKNETYTLRDLIYGMMLPSGNDAAIAIAIGMYGSISAFADRMNEKALEIGMTSSHFENPNGLHHEDHYTTARDMALLSAYALQNESFRKVISTKEYTAVAGNGNRLKVRTTNRYMRNYTSKSYTPQSVLWDEAIGIKTGETPYAGKCFIAAAQRNDTIYIACLFHGDMPSSSASLKKQDAYSVVRYKDARSLIEYAFEHDLTTVTAKDLVSRGVPDRLERGADSANNILSSTYRIDWSEEAVYQEPACIFPEELLQDPIPEDLIHIEWFDVPLQTGTEAGRIDIVYEQNVLFSAPILCETVELPTPTPTAEPTPIPSPTPSPAAEIEVIPYPIITDSPQPTETPAQTRHFLSCGPQPVTP